MYLKHDHLALIIKLIKKNKNIRNPNFLTNLERQRKDKPATLLNDNCTTLLYGLALAIARRTTKQKMGHGRDNNLEQDERAPRKTCPPNTGLVHANPSQVRPN
ncbi:hypothetical protein C1H46_045654 [Malus baccata]|uniref:Uncharacterized protein n=1 Tax=Malus baccata TaxID=106549 RepID=A0A540K3K4_MALBA|nr:hypothetical protein C1H46_045654 [Malus baccata]